MAYWYLRLNGYLLLEDFVIHDETSDQQQTEIDMLGVRFRNRKENYLYPMQDDQDLLQNCTTDIHVVIVEVKRGLCALNGPWRKQEDQNMHRILRAVGCFPEYKVNPAARDLYKKGIYKWNDVTCEIIAIGDRRNEEIVPNSINQLVFSNMLKFIHCRFQNYKNQKRSVGNWQEDGRKLQQMATQQSNKDLFIQDAREYFGLPKLQNSQ